MYSSKTGFWVQNHPLNLCSSSMNSQRLLRSQKAGVKYSNYSVLEWKLFSKQICIYLISYIYIILYTIILIVDLVFWHYFVIIEMILLNFNYFKIYKPSYLILTIYLSIYLPIYISIYLSIYIYISSCHIKFTP